MSRIILLADHNLENAIIRAVKRADRSIVFPRLRDLDLHEAEDDAVLAFAARERMVVVTNDRDTMPGFAEARIARQLPMTGLILLRPKSSIAKIASDLVMIVSIMTAEEWTNKTEWVPL